jgi:MFS family permease
VVFVVAFAASVMEVRALSKTYEPRCDVECVPIASNSGGSRTFDRRALLGQIARAGFTPRAMLFYFGWMMAQPLFTIYYVRVLDCGNLWVAVFSIVSSMAQYLSFPVWSRYAARKGNTAALAAATAGMALTPVMVAISPRPWMVAAFNVSMGFFTSGTTLLMLNTLLEVSPAENRTDFIAYHNAAVNLTSFIGPLIGRALVDSLNIRWALVMAGAFRAAGSLAFAALSRRSEHEALHVTGPRGGEAC